MYPFTINNKIFLWKENHRAKVAEKAARLAAMRIFCAIAVRACGKSKQVSSGEVCLLLQLVVFLCVSGIFSKKVRK